MFRRSRRGNGHLTHAEPRASAVALLGCACLFGAIAVPVIASTDTDRGSHAAAAATTFALQPPPSPRPHTLRHAAMPARPRPRASAGPIATVLGRGGVAIPRSFFGLSVEDWDIPLLERHPGTLARLLQLLSASGDGPFVLRVGGDSADHSLWDADPHRGSELYFELTPAWFRELRRAVSTAHLRLLLDLNLAARAPEMAAALTREALRELPRRSITALEIGNEPDLYGREPSYRLETLADVRPGTSWSWNHYSPRRYAAAFLHYANAVAAADADRIPLAGPEVANPVGDLRWVKTLVEDDPAAVGLVTAHRYPYSACARRSSRYWPTIARVLSPRASSGLAASVEPVAALAASAHLAFRLTEMDSVTCGGVLGVSNTFATALWAPDALFSLLADRISGVNVHVRQGTFNEAFAITRRGLDPHPLLYGLLAFVRTLSSGRTLLPTKVNAPARDNVKIWAVRTAGGYLHVIVLDKGVRTVRLPLVLPTHKTAVVEWLTAPGIGSTAGVTLAGQRLNHAGRWTGRLRSGRLAPRRNGYELTLPPYSAALLNVKQ